jgi:hypothetical protein
MWGNRRIHLGQRSVRFRNVGDLLDRLKELGLGPVLRPDALHGGIDCIRHHILLLDNRLMIALGALLLPKPLSRESKGENYSQLRISVNPPIARRLHTDKTRPAQCTHRSTPGRTHVGTHR